MKKKIFALASIACALTMVMAVGCNSNDNNDKTGDNTNQTQTGDNTGNNGGNTDNTGNNGGNTDNTGNNGGNTDNTGNNGGNTTNPPAATAQTYTFAVDAVRSANSGSVGSDDKTTADITFEIFTLTKGLKLEAGKGINTQGKTVTVKINHDGGSISFNGTGASSTKTITLEIKNTTTGTTVFAQKEIANKATETVSLTGLTAGTYEIITSASVRIENFVVVS